MQYFVSTTDVRKEDRRSGSAPLLKREYPELACATLDQAIDQAKRRVLESDRTIMLRADACSRNNNQVRTKYRCWIDERGAFNELEPSHSSFLREEVGQVRNEAHPTYSRERRSAVI